MAEFTVLGDAVIKALLLDLSKDEIEYFLKELEDCLITFSRGKERQYQPKAGIINRPDGQKVLFRPFTSSETVGAKIIVHPAPIPKDSGSSLDNEAKQQLPLHGTLVLCNKYGLPTGFLNAAEVTGYRTSLSAMVPFVSRLHTSKIVVFGAGKQALWHTRLALALRGADINLITIVNRSEPRARELISTVREENEERWKSPGKFEFLNSSQGKSDEKIQLRLADADAIFCTVASQTPLFSLQSLALETRRGRYPLITAVGSWQSDMIEVHPAILQRVIKSNGFNVPGDTPGAVLVDDAEASLIHSGEIVQSGLEMSEMLEIGNILHLKRNSDLTNDQSAWLAEGLIVYKSIGVSTTDLAAGNAILALAERKKLGTRVSGF
ncbi:uncharacterized protein N7511_004961 [Penicillium nucicola]|uniref:uncharacterized protein n=1 Tax=Penicillium nucicola TaxID=1850975 RepID=UPI0025459FC9|nr:uncharacterized protein N7511_004961 [Penicillium nucicola]KAJ5767345.1 hypothetical protein N7511_004961 [Penicillium nucicola]